MAEAWLSRKTNTTTSSKPPQKSNAKPPQQQKQQQKQQQQQQSYDDFVESEDEDEEEEEPKEKERESTSFTNKLRQLRAPWDIDVVGEKSSKSKKHKNDPNNNNNNNTKKHSKEPPLKKPRIEHDSQDDIDSVSSGEEQNGIGARALLSSQKGKGLDFQKRKPSPPKDGAHTDSDGQEDIVEQGDKDEEDAVDHRDANFLMNLVSPLKSLPFYNKDQIENKSFPTNPARRLVFAPTQVKKEVEEDIDEEASDSMIPQRSQRQLPMKNVNSSLTTAAPRTPPRTNPNTSINTTTKGDKEKVIPPSLTSFFGNASQGSEDQITSDEVVSGNADANKGKDSPPPSPLKFKMKKKEKIEDEADGIQDHPILQRQQGDNDEEEIDERKVTSAWLEGETNTMRAQLFSSPRHNTTRSKWLDDYAPAQVPTQHTTYSPRIMKGGMIEKLHRVLRQFHINQQQNTLPQTETLRVLVLHELSKIQPHVTVVLCLLLPPTDSSEIDFAGDNYALLRTHELVYVLFTRSASEELKLGIGSMVEILQWQELHSGMERRVFLNIKSSLTNTVYIDEADAQFSLFIKQLELPAGYMSNLPLVHASATYPVVNLPIDGDSPPDDTPTQATPPLPKLISLDKLHPHILDSIN